MDNPCYHYSGHIFFDSTVMKLGQDACLGNCSNEFDGSGERSRAVLALLFVFAFMFFVLFLFCFCWLMINVYGLMFYEFELPLI
jgi:hypothetical protein